MKITVIPSANKLEIKGNLCANTEELVVIARSDAKKHVDASYKLLISCRGQFLAVLDLTAADDYTMDALLDLSGSDVDDFTMDGRDGDNTVFVTLYRVAESEYFFIGYGKTKMIYSD